MANYWLFAQQFAFLVYSRCFAKTRCFHYLWTENPVNLTTKPASFLFAGRSQRGRDHTGCGISPHPRNTA